MNYLITKEEKRINKIIDYINNNFPNNNLHLTTTPKVDCNIAKEFRATDSFQRSNFVRRLINKGVNVNIRIKSGHFYGSSFLFYFCQLNNLETIKYLVSKGAIITGTDIINVYDTKNGLETIKFLLNNVDEKHINAVFDYYAVNKNITMAKYMLDNFNVTEVRDEIIDTIKEIVLQKGIKMVDKLSHIIKEKKEFYIRSEQIDTLLDSGFKVDDFITELAVRTQDKQLIERVLINGGNIKSLKKEVISELLEDKSFYIIDFLIKKGLDEKIFLEAANDLVKRLLYNFYF